MATKWEYMVLYVSQAQKLKKQVWVDGEVDEEIEWLSAPGITARLNLLGNSGWEVSSMVPMKDYYSLIFKRPK
jgi:hypothetical protein